MKNKRVIITGQEGYIGKYLWQFLERTGYDVLGLDIKTGNDITQKLKDEYHSFKPDYIFHLAAQTSVQESIINPQKNFNTNVSGTLNILRLGGKIIFTSTGAIYGNKLMAKESDNPSPQSPYAISKFIAEQFIQYSCPPCVILRIGNVYGRNNPKGVINALKKKGKIFGDGTNQRDYIYIDDVIKALCEATKWRGGIYNIGTGIETSVNEIANLLKIEKRYAPAKMEQKFISLDNSKAIKTGWRPKCQLKDYYDK